MGGASRRRFIALTLALTAWLAGQASADWPHLRGPNCDGVSNETGLAEAWPAAGPPRLWSRELGQGYSGFVVADGRLCTQRQALGGQTVLCLDPDTGAVLWETRIDSAWHSKGAYPGPYATPTFHRGKVYAVSPTGMLACLDAVNGSSLWSVDLKERFQGKGWGFGYAATPLVEDGRVVLPVGGENASLVALDAADGRTIWAVGSDPASYCPAYPITFQGRRCIVGYLQNAVVIVAAADGKLLHRQPLSSGYDEHSAWPIYHEPHLLLTAPFRVPASKLLLEPAADGGLTCKPKWTSKELCNDVVSSVLHEGNVYGFDLKQLQSSKHRASRGTFKCVDWATGKVRWATDEVGHASVIVADGKLLMLNDTGSVILARADPTAYHELARASIFDDDEICWTPPTLWQGRLFVRSPSRAVCLYVGKPGEQPRIDTTKRRTLTRLPRFDPAWLFSREREFPNDAPSRDEMLLWFAACLGVFVVAAILALVAKRTIARRVPAAVSLWLLAFLLGIAGPNFLSAWLDRCVFTWPAALYAAFHLTLMAGAWAARNPENRRAPWLARLALVGFVLVGWTYFELCKSVGMFVGWSFLFGFPAAFPFTWLAVRAENKSQRAFAAAWALLAFTAYFAGCQALLLWNSAHAESL